MAWATGLVGLAMLFFSVVGYSFSFTMFACAAVFIGFAPSMPLRTRAGVVEWHRAYALREGILMLAEGNGPTGAPEFDHLFPYALVLGVADDWTRAHRAVPVRPPAWFIGLHTRDAVEIADALGELARTLGSALRYRAGGRRDDDLGGSEPW